METTIRRKQTSFRLRTDLLEEMKNAAKKENRTLNNYLESLLLNYFYNEPNEVTRAAIEEAMSRKEYPEGEIYNSVDELFKALDTE